MATAITVTNIDATFPVAGQDNDSQGFRDNFSQIKTQLTTAGTEITALQTNSAVTNADTDFNGHDQSELVLKDWGQKVVAKGSVSGSVACSFADGNVTTNFTLKAKGSWSNAELVALCPVSQWDAVFASQVDSVITNPPAVSTPDNGFSVPS